MRLSREEIESQDRYLLRRRGQFRRAAERLAEVLAENPAVERVALFGSVAKPPWKEIPRFREFRRAKVAVWHECNDVDLAVWLNDLSGLSSLRKKVARTLDALHQEETIGVPTNLVELFILEPGTDRYLGRLCRFSACPKAKPDCRVPGCGDTRFLQQHEGFTFYPDALDEAVVLYDRNTHAGSGDQRR